MSTSMVPVPAKTWTKISAVSVQYQIPEQSEAWVVEAAVIPTTLDIRIKILPSKIYSFTRLDGDLYMYSDTSISVAIDPVA